MSTLSNAGVKPSAVRGVCSITSAVTHQRTALRENLDARALSWAAIKQSLLPNIVPVIFIEQYGRPSCPYVSRFLMHKSYTELVSIHELISVLSRFMKYIYVYIFSSDFWKLRVWGFSLTSREICRDFFIGFSLQFTRDLANLSNSRLLKALHDISEIEFLRFLVRFFWICYDFSRDNFQLTMLDSSDELPTKVALES